MTLTIGKDHVRKNILSNWEQKETSVVDGRFMRIRTLDEEPDNGNTPKEGDGTNREAILTPRENAYETSNTAFTFGAYVVTNPEASENVSTFGVAPRVKEKSGNSESQNVGEEVSPKATQECCVAHKEYTLH